MRGLFPLLGEAANVAVPALDTGGSVLKAMIVSASAAQRTFFVCFLKIFFVLSALLATRESSPKGPIPENFSSLCSAAYRGETLLFSFSVFLFSAEMLNTERGLKNYFRKQLVFKPNPLNMLFIEATKTSFSKRSSELCCSLGENRVE